jgi:iron complex outermembrane receptor protein
VRVLWNGIPLTVADGQTPVDYIDMESVDRVEVIRGSASALFGNSSGGVIALSSQDTTNQVALKQWSESGAGRKVAARIHGATSAFSVGAGVSRTSGRGFRDYSRVEATRASASLSARAVGQPWSLNLSLLDMPVAQNPGSITRTQMTANARLADPFSVRKGAGKSVEQKQVGLSTSRAIARAELSALVFAGTRQLENPLTFATVDLNRSSGGGSVKAAIPFTLSGLASSLNAGVDAQIQNDDRHELENCTDLPVPPVSVRCPSAGSATGAIRRDQRELVTSLGVYTKMEFALDKRAAVSLAARHDVLRFRVDDRMPVPAAAKQSGNRTMMATSPMAGIVYRIAPAASFYASASTAFETPTVTELANKPDGTTGLNGELRPQVSKTAEIGLKGFLRSGLQYDFAGFLTGVDDELIPFEIAGGAGRRFYRNAGHTKRSGFEASAASSFGPAQLTAAYTASHFRFDSYTVSGTSYSGKTIPGIPTSKLDAALTVRGRRSFATAESSMSSAVFVDDSNSTTSPGYAIFNVRTGTSIPVSSLSIKPVIGVTNVLNRRYSASVSINAAGGKYYEPGSERLLYGMVEIESRF